MPTNANTFNSRVTSEALEKKFRDVFPAQGGAELVQDLYASGVVQPVIDFSSVAEGSVLPAFLQTAWDFSTGSSYIANTTTALITNPGFWQVDLTLAAVSTAGGANKAELYLDTGITTKKVWLYESGVWTVDNSSLAFDDKFVVFLRSGDTLRGTTTAANVSLNVWYRQVADVNGNLVNPLGFTFS